MADAYTDPKLYGVDYTVISDKAEETAKGIGTAMTSLALQRQKAREKLDTEYADFNDKTFIERAKGFNEEQTQSIRDSVDVNIEDFSRMSPADRQKAINGVKDIKSTQQALSSIIQLKKDPNVNIDKRLDADIYTFLSDAANMKNIKHVPNKNGIGFSIIHQPTDIDGNPEGEAKTYEMSDIINMQNLVKDNAPVLEKVEGELDGMVNKAQAAAREAVNGGQPYGQENWIGIAQNHFRRMNQTEKEVWYSENVEPFGEMYPTTTIDGDGNERKLSERERVLAAKNNESRLEQSFIDYMEAEISREYPARLTPNQELNAQLKREKLKNEGLTDEKSINRILDIKESWDDYVYNGDTKINDFLLDDNLELKRIKRNGEEKIELWETDIVAAEGSDGERIEGKEEKRLKSFGIRDEDAFLNYLMDNYNNKFKWLRDDLIQDPRADYTSKYPSQNVKKDIGSSTSQDLKNQEGKTMSDRIEDKMKKLPK